MLSRFICRFQKSMDSPTPMTSRVLRVRCLISVGLNQNILVDGLGPYVIVYSYGFSGAMIGGGCGRGALALQCSGQLWFSGSLCSAQ